MARPLRQLDDPLPAPETLMDVGLRLLALIDARRLHEWQCFHLSVTQLRYLQVLAEYEEAPRLSEVAQRTRVHPAHITSMTKRMQALGLIDLVVDPADAAPEYWRHLHNRLAAGHEARPYTRDQHAAWLKRRSVTL